MEQPDFIERDFEKIKERMLERVKERTGKEPEIKRQQIINQGGDHIEANFTINNNGGNMTEQEIRKIATNTVSDLQQRAQLNSERSYGRKRW